MNIHLLLVNANSANKPEYTAWSGGGEGAGKRTGAGEGGAGARGGGAGARGGVGGCQSGAEVARSRVGFEFC